VRSLKKIESTLLILTVFVVLAIAGPVITRENFRVDRKIVEKAEKKYGKDARALLIAWEDLIRHDRSLSDLEKLEKVNQFFNRMEFVDDIRHWGEKDYWATPIEFLSSQGGDCEDFSIAKYFTLKAMGVDEGKLNLTYVKALQYNMHHMVMTYYSKPGAVPLVLDNLVDPIKPAYSVLTVPDFGWPNSVDEASWQAAAAGSNAGGISCRECQRTNCKQRV
jgi:predicted transglutaminase-like cysteine proteinase